MILVIASSLTMFPHFTCSSKWRFSIVNPSLCIRFIKSGAMCDPALAVDVRQKTLWYWICCLDPSRTLRSSACTWGPAGKNTLLVSLLFGSGGEHCDLALAAEFDCFPWLANASDITAVHALQVKWNWSSFQLNCLHNWTWTASANMYVHDSYIYIYGRDCNNVNFHHPASIWPFGPNCKFQIRQTFI